MAIRPEPEPRARIPWKVVLTLWAIYGLITSLQEIIGALAYGRQQPIWFAFAQMMPQAALWALLTPSFSGGETGSPQGARGGRGGC